MYKSIKLEKALYNLSGKTFTQALEVLDPKENYKDSPLASLDAFERQLKRFNIKVNGSDCDVVDKFFTTTESAVLFPEFVRRCIKKGFDESVLNNIIAVSTKCESNQYLGCVLDDSASYVVTDESDELPASVVTESSTTTTLNKYGRLVKASFEAVRQQKLDVFGVMLRSIGIKLANCILAKAVSVLSANITPITVDTLDYSALTELYGSFNDFNMNRVVISSSNAATVLALSQMDDIVVDNQGKIILPFGSEIIRTAEIDDDTIIGLDKDFALELITSSDIVLDTDKLISRQLDLISVSINCGFRRITDDAVKVLTIAADET